MTAPLRPDPARDDGLAGKVAVITGGASGIGKALAVAYARAGTVSVLGRYPEDPHDVRQAVHSPGPRGLAEAARVIPWGRVGSTDEAARTIRFLTSDDAAYATGQQLIVDGGLTVRWPS